MILAQYVTHSFIKHKQRTHPGHQGHLFCPKLHLVPTCMIMVLQQKRSIWNLWPASPLWKGINSSGFWPLVPLCKLLQKFCSKAKEHAFLSYKKRASINALTLSTKFIVMSSLRKDSQRCKFWMRVTLFKARLRYSRSYKSLHGCPSSAVCKSFHNRHNYACAIHALTKITGSWWSQATRKTKG